MTDEQRVVAESESDESPLATAAWYLRYGLSLPERALRSGAGLVGGAVREWAELLVPQAFQDSKTYRTLVRQTLDFVVDDIAGVDPSANDGKPLPGQSGKVDNFVARKAVGNFVDLAGLASIHLSPILLLAVVSDVAHGSKQYLQELAVELKKQGVIDEQSTINHAQDLLAAVSQASGTAATAFDTPPLSVDALRDTIEQTTAAVKQVDPTKLIPEAELAAMWRDMREMAQRENVNLLQLSTAMTLYSLDKLGVVAQGALSSVKVAGLLFDRHILDHYRDALTAIHVQGYFQTLAAASEPYIEAVWYNFSPGRRTLTDDLLSGGIFQKAWSTVTGWLGSGAEKPAEELTQSPPATAEKNAEGSVG